MTLERGHTALGVFVPWIHSCPGWETCQIARWIEKQEKKNRQRFLIDFRRERAVELGQRSGADYTEPPANSEVDSEPALPQAGNPIVTESPATS